MKCLFSNKTESDYKIPHKIKKIKIKILQQIHVEFLQIPQRAGKVIPVKKSKKKKYHRAQFIHFFPLYAAVVVVVLFSSQMP